MNTRRSLLPLTFLAAIAAGIFAGTHLSMGQSQPATAPAAAKKQVLSQVVSYAALQPKTPGGNQKSIFDGPTVTLNNLEGHITVLGAGQESHPPHQHINEETIILIEGELDVAINGKVTPARKGDVLFFSSNDWHNVKNTGTTPATYYVFNWNAPVRPGMSPSTAPNPNAAASAPATH